MNVRSLIEALSHFPMDAEVRVDTPTGDYWRTHIAARTLDVEMVECAWSDYHRDYQMPKDGVLPEGSSERPNKTFVVIV